MKASPILIYPVEELRRIPPAEREVIRDFLFKRIRGIDRKHDRRWRRLWRRIWEAPEGEAFQLYSAEERGGPYHRMHRAVLGRLFQAQELYTDEDLLHDWLKLRCWFITWGEGARGNPIPRPRSTAFAECSEDEIREFHTKFIDLLHQPWVQRRFWPHLDAAKRQQMVDIVLSDPTNPQEGA